MNMRNLELDGHPASLAMAIVLIVGVSAFSIISMQSRGWPLIPREGKPIRFELPSADLTKPGGPSLPVSLVEPADPVSEAATAETDRDISTAHTNQTGVEELTDPAKLSMSVSSPANGLLPIDFNLSDRLPSRSDEGSAERLEVEKNLRLNGAVAGTARIRIGSDETVSIDRVKLKETLAAAGFANLANIMGEPSNSREFVTFDEIRRQGINVRYDPVGDQIVVAN